MGPAGDGGLRTRVRRMMEDHWSPTLGWSVPNRASYPWLWLWDSSFHALVWDALDDPRTLQELAGVFAAQRPSGFVPHINYAADPGFHEAFWRVRGASCITQPPMYGHALATLHRRGWDVGPLLGPATRAMARLLDRRSTQSGLVRILHPWESGIDDHPRWAAWQPDPWDRAAWRETKGRLVDVLVIEDGEAVSSPAFDVCPAGFNALVAWNASELAGVTGDAELHRRADALAARLDRQWDAGLATWVDAAPDGTPGSRVRTLDALLPVLVTSDPARAEAAFAQILSPDAYGSAFGPGGVHVGEASYVADSYGRGSAWPHLTYLLVVAAHRRGLGPVAAELTARLVAGANGSGLAEHWDPRTGAGLGARPQGWTGLALAADRLVAGERSAAGTETTAAAALPWPIAVTPATLPKGPP